MSGGDPQAAARAAALVSLFTDAAAFGSITPVDPASVPEPYRSLLDHESHMTVAMERRHRGAVGLRVVAEAAGPGDVYAREILLTAADRRVVQYGIVRIDLGAVDESTAGRIRAGVKPLGRILVEAGALCSVGDVALVAVVPGTHLQRLIGPRPTFGRVAGIAVAGRKAVELLEIVVEA